MFPCPHAPIPPSSLPEILGILDGAYGIQLGVFGIWFGVNQEGIQQYTNWYTVDVLSGIGGISSRHG